MNKTRSAWRGLKWIGWWLIMLSFAPMALAQNQLLDVDFKRDQQQASLILVLDNDQVMVDMQRQDNQLRIELFDTQTDDGHIARLDVTDFATAVSQVQIERQHNNLLLTVEVDGEFEYDDHLDGAVLTVNIQKPRLSPEAQRFQARGERMSLNFQNVPVRSVLQLIADYNQFNLIVADSVTGDLTLRLDGVPWQQLLDTILKSQGLGKRVEDNVVLVAPRQELEQQLEWEANEGRALGESPALQSTLIPVRFANAADIASMIGHNGGFRLLSKRGVIAIDERTNTLLIRESPRVLQEIRRMIEQLDVPVKQVQIEARIVSVNEGNLDELGVRWGVMSQRGDLRIGGSVTQHRGQANGGQNGVSEPDALSLEDVLNVNLGATSSGASSLAFQMGRLSSDFLLDLELSALQRESKAEVISSPRLMTTNKQAAYIEQGTEIPYLESSSSGATSVAFKKAVLSLEVTPQITPDNRLILDLSVTQDRPGEVVQTGTGEAVAINTQRIGTQVLVDNGETVVLGGIFQHSVNTTTDKVPLLGDLPWLGALFRHTYEQLGKSELLIFVTPRVVEQREYAYQRKINLH